MPSMVGRSSVADRLTFGVLALLALSRLTTQAASPRTVGQVTALLLIALVGFRYASFGRVSRAWGALAFVVAWFWLPVLPLIALWLVGRRRPAVSLEPGAPAEARASPVPPGADGQKVDARIASGEGVPAISQSLLALKVAAEAGQKVKALHAPFASVYGDGVVPVLLETEGRELGLYTESGPWDWPAKERCLKWLGLLRTSDREDLEVEIRSDAEVPELVTFYARNTPRTVFELVGFLQYRWAVPEFARENAATLRRLASEYLGLELGRGEAGLEALDRLVAETLRADGHVLPSSVILLGSFFGETLVERHGGNWLTRGEDIEEVVVEVRAAAGVIEANVFGKVLKLFRNGIEDSTLWMARSIAEKLEAS